MPTSLDQQVAELGEDHDILVILAALQKLPAEDRALISNAWKRHVQKHRQLIESEARRTKILKIIQESLSQLRLDMKYIVFDLEATRRERDELKRKYEPYDVDDNSSDLG